MASAEEVLNRIVAMEGVVGQRRDQIARQQQGAQQVKKASEQVQFPPDKFSGELGENAKYKDGVTWENWSFVLAAYCMAVDPRMDELMRDAAKVDADSYSHEYLDEEARRVNTNLYYILALTCKSKAQGIVKSVPSGEGLEAWRLLCVEFEPKVPSRFSGMLDSILYPHVQDNDPIKGMVSWETLVQRYEEQTGEKVMGSIKKAVLSTRLVPTRLREHLALNATRFATYASVRAAVLNYLRSTQAAMALSGPAPMDLDALAFGKHGKGGKGKYGKGMDGKRQGVRQYHDEPAMHVLREKGPQVDGEGYVFLMTEGENEDLDDQEITDHTEELDHIRVADYSVDVDAKRELNYDINKDDGSYLIPIGEFENENDGIIEVIVDSRVARSVCPPGFAPRMPRQEADASPLRQADRAKIYADGCKTVHVEVAGTKQPVRGQCDVRDVRKTITAVRDLTRGAQGVWFDEYGGAVVSPTVSKKIREMIEYENRCNRTNKPLKIAKRRGFFSFDDSDEAQGPEVKKECYKPTAEETAIHERTHMPYREAPTIPVISMDYCFVNTEMEAEMINIQVVVQKPEDAVASIMVVHKGPIEYVNSAVELYLDVEKAPEGFHHSNGAIENAVERVESLLRALHGELEAKLEVKIGPESLIMPWLVRHAGYLLTRLAIATDGRAAWGRLGRAKFKSGRGKLGGAIDCKIQAKDYSKQEPGWGEGVFLSRRDGSDEIIVGAARGIEHARTMRPKAKEDKYKQEVYNAFIGVPWNPRGLEVKDQNEVVRIRSRWLQQINQRNLRRKQRQREFHHHKRRQRRPEFESHDWREKISELQFTIEQDVGMTGNAIVAGGDVAHATPRRDEGMEIGIAMSIPKEEDRHVCEETEPRANNDMVVGDGVYRDACTGEELLKELVINGRTKEMNILEEFEVFGCVSFEDWMKPFDTEKCDLQNIEWIVGS
ncbi:unnamed protein product [Prorocentrum cordatum]|uniref:Uncharacterized protein n=1 Tax=Prorocentrum cordatum TaxID=2364126 RepID=A0ABN9U7F7_9DINO|nr:unnamed protein product [Polarella glacialis]